MLDVGANPPALGGQLPSAGDYAISNEPESAANGTLYRIEHDSEALVAGLRVIVFLVLIGIFWWTDAVDRDHTVMFSLSGFGTITIVSLGLALAGYYRPWLPWIFTTFDVGLLIHCLAMFAIAMQMPASEMLDGPGAWLIFLYLAMAAVRYRPGLVLYTGLLFAGGWVAVWLVAQGPPTSSVGVLAVFAGEMGRLTVMVVTTLALMLMTARTRRSVRTALAETRLRATLSRYFAGDVLREVVKMTESGARLRNQKAAVMFADIRGFTALAEHMPAPEVARLLGEYRSCIAKPVAEHGGTIDKFIGDGVMIVFGVPRSSANDSRNALRCGLAIKEALMQWNGRRVRVGQAPLEVGIGIHFGFVVAGILGGQERLEFTVIGDTVNVASRIDKHASESGLSIVVSEEILSAAGELNDERWCSMGSLPLRGRSGKLRLYALSTELTGRDGRNPDAPA